ncbi:MAG: ParB/RepB/Spo0J family partition protein [Thermoleophilia bacterium]
MSSVALLAIDSVQPNPDQPRKSFNQEKLEELAASITEHGLIQPVSVVARGSQFMIVAGERRWRACKIAGRKQIEAIVMKVNKRKVAELALIENIQREDMDPIETAFGYKALLNSGLDIKEIAAKLGKKTNEIRYYLQLTRLGKQLQEAVKLGAVNLYLAWEIARLEDLEEQQMIFRKVRDAQLKANQVSNFITSYLAAREQTAFFEAPTEREVMAKETRDEIERMLEAAAKLLWSVEEKLEQNESLDLTDHLLEKIAMSGKSMVRIAGRVASAKKTSQLLSEIQLEVA